MLQIQTQNNISICQAEKDFEISSSILKKAIKLKLLHPISVPDGESKIILNRQEVESKLPILRTGSNFITKLLSNKYKKKRKEAIVDLPKNQPLSIRLEKVKSADMPQIQVTLDENAPKWLSAPCIGCTCDEPEKCQKLTEWVERG